VLEKKYQDVLDLNGKEYDEAQQEVDEHSKAHFTCWVPPLSGLVASM
jgi:hypothetical protein